LNLFIGSVLEVMLQKLVEAEKSFGKKQLRSYSKDLFNEFQLLDGSFLQVFNLSFSKCIISYPFIVAVLKLEPHPGLTSQ